MTKRTLFPVAFTSEYRVLGLYSQQKDYRLSWLLNNALSLELRKVRDFEYLPHKHPEKVGFSLYGHEDHHFRLNFYLLNNRYQQWSLIHDPSNLDFLLLLNADDSRYDIDALVAAIRRLPQVSAVFDLDGIFKRKWEGFLFDFEIFVDHELNGKLVTNP